jgi:undecaprenyl-diphosphatase
MTIFEVLVLGLIEGLTEFLPVSSTGHMILASHLMGTSSNDFLKSFEIAIQLGAILSVVIIYFKRFIMGLNIYKKLFMAFIPTGVVGFLAYKTIKLYLFDPYIVSAMLILGGIILIVLDKWSASRVSKFQRAEDLPLRGAFIVGLVQCLSMIPGVSRAAATIFGGLIAGLDRKQATEFSFLLAVPTMCAATGYDLLKTGGGFSNEQWMLLIMGGVVSFISAMLAIKFFIYAVASYGFRHFGYYRIVVGIAFLIVSPPLAS